MATLTVCSRLNGKPKRFKLEGVNIDGKVSELKGRLSDEVKFSAHELGKILQYKSSSLSPTALSAVEQDVLWSDLRTTYRLLSVGDGPDQTVEVSV